MSGDMGEIFTAMRQASQEKRAKNRERSQALLVKAGIQFTTHNNGAHLVVAERYDFWPGTGYWRARGENTARRGVHKLIARILATQP